MRGAESSSGAGTAVTINLRGARGGGEHMVEGMKAVSEGVELLITTRHATYEAQRHGQLVRVAKAVETPVGMVGQDVLPALRHTGEKAARRLPRGLQNRRNTISPSTCFDLKQSATEGPQSDCLNLERTSQR